MMIINCKMTLVKLDNWPGKFISLVVNIDEKRKKQEDHQLKELIY
jgi:hypothetical protein